MAYPAIVLPRRDEILALLRSGKRLSDLEPIIGVTDSAISAALKSDPEYKDALLHSYRRRLDKAEDEIVGAPTKVDVSRASAYHRAIAWRAGVEHPEMWGQHTTVTIDLGAGLQDALARTRERVIEGECRNDTPELPDTA